MTGGRRTWPWARSSASGRAAGSRSARSCESPSLKWMSRRDRCDWRCDPVHPPAADGRCRRRLDPMSEEDVVVPDGPSLARWRDSEEIAREESRKNPRGAGRVIAVNRDGARGNNPVSPAISPAPRGIEHGNCCGASILTWLCRLAGSVAQSTGAAIMNRPCRARRIPVMSEVSLLHRSDVWYQERSEA